ncbi:hypothetical protein GCM10025794_37180 [Massilia kyonggiensis]
MERGAKPYISHGRKSEIIKVTRGPFSKRAAAIAQGTQRMLSLYPRDHCEH